MYVNICFNSAYRQCVQTMGKHMCIVMCIGMFIDMCIDMWRHGSRAGKVQGHHRSYTVMAYVVMAYIVMAYIVMA